MSYSIAQSNRQYCDGHPVLSENSFVKGEFEIFDASYYDWEMLLWWNVSRTFGVVPSLEVRGENAQAAGGRFTPGMSVFVSRRDSSRY